MSKLTPLQERFCEEYIVDLNASKAAVRAGYSEKTSRSIASELLAKSHIQQRIAELKASRSERVKVDADFVLKKLQLSADLDHLALIDEYGKFKPLKDIPEEIRKLIIGFDTHPFTGEILGYKFLPRTKSVEMLAKHTGVLTEKVEVKADETLAGLLAAVGKLKNESNGGA